uniref:Uncharacterized mitochondrial protein AtMg00810-like n=1 Tax=Tanacetum cinerariifolium TaxID=118510 RepID=A0A6L2MUW4_TANCI|nr:uncharacterized mitochondrial protein AtMg00810-like [Tanacetum cinerariifolium]
MIIKTYSKIVEAKEERIYLALKAKKESSDEECSNYESEDEEYAMAVRDFKRRGGFVRQPQNDKKMFQRRRDDKNGKSDRKCFRCGDLNHLIGECPKPLKDKNQRAFVGGSWSDSGEEDNEKAKDKTCIHGGNVISGSNLRDNIIGKGQICDNKCRLTFFEHDSEITKDGKVIGGGIRKKGLYVMKLGNKAKDKICLATIDENSTLWHRRLGHANMRLIKSLASKNIGTIKFRNDHVAKIMGYGDYKIGNVTILRVYFVEGLGHNLFSMGQFCDSDLEVAFRQHTCFIRNLYGVDFFIGSRGNNLYTLSLKDMMMSSPICLLSKASKTKSWLWHFRLSHLNFACAMGKCKKKSHKPISEDNNQEKLYLLHMDLCGPMCVESVNGKNVDPQAPKVIAPNAAVIPPVQAESTCLPSSTTVDQDAPSLMDPTLFIHRNDNDLLLVQIYVDDIIFAASTPELCDLFANLMCSKFKMSMKGKISFFLGLQISQSPRGIFINQSKYALESLKKYGFEYYDPVDTLMVEKSKLDEDKEGKSVDLSHYRGMIGTLLYLTASRPNLQFAICMCARYQDRPTEKHHLQMWIMLVSKIHAAVHLTMALDSTNFMDVHHSRSKHIDIRYHFIMEQVENGVIELYFVNTEYQLADLFTKAPGRVYDVLRLTPLFKAFLVTANVPEIYMQELWATATVYHHSIRFKMDNKKHIVNLESFRAMLHICPRLPHQPFVKPPFEEEILAFLRFLGHNGAIKRLIDEDFVYQVEHKDIKNSNEMYYPRFTKVIIHHFMSNDLSIPRRNKVNWHYVRDDHMFTMIKLVSRHQNTQQFDALMPIELTNEYIRNSNANKEYYGVATGATPHKPKASDDDEGDDGDDGEEGNNDYDDAQDDDDQEDEGNDEDDQKEGSDDEDEESFDPISKTPENTYDEGNGEENLGTNVGREEGQDEEKEEDELYKDDNINLGRGMESILETTSQMDVQTPTSVLLKTIDENMQKIIKEQVKEQVKTSYAVAADLSEMELKKILNEKMEGNKSIQRSNKQRNLYKALIKAYESDKIILDTYEDTFRLKRHRDDDAHKDKEPSARSDWGSKRRREGKEPELASAPKEKAIRSTGKST